MDEEVDPDDENVNSVLAEESSELLHILSSQSPVIILKLCQMMPGGAGWSISEASMSSSTAEATERIKATLEYFILANSAVCRNFLQSMCILCENIPMRLESRLMSVAGHASSVYEHSSPSGTDEKPSSPPSQPPIKCPRIDHWEQYIAAVMCLLQRRWERLSEHLVREVQLENVWVSVRTANRVRDSPDHTPRSADKGGTTPEPDGDFGSMDSRVTLEAFFQGCAGKVTVLVGHAGSGKTLLMYCLGQQWAHGLSPIPSSYLFVLLEFRQLNTLSQPLSLCELLLRHYLPPKGGNDEKRAVVDYLLSNPEQSCWVLDGYDEFHSKLIRQEAQRELLDPEKPLPVADLITGLLNRQLLPGCTVVVTCRVRDVIDLEGLSDKVGQLLGWDRREIKQYVDNFFGVKGHVANRALAADLLLSSQHLLAMSTLPALCNICCICVDNLLQEEERRKTEEKGAQIREGRREEEGSRGEKYVHSGDQGGGSEDTNGRAQLPPRQAHIPSTLTQVYLTVLHSFLSRDPDTRGGNSESKVTRLPQSTVSMLMTLSQYRLEVRELSHLAWKGLEDSKILFMEEDISQDVLEFAIRTGLLSPVELRHEDGMLLNSYCFIHLTLQEFLAALRIMTSADVSDTQLKNRFSLRTRWKSKQRTVFTDSLHLYVCGLASPHCTPALVQISRTSSGTGAESWVQKRQTLVLKLLKNLCHSNTLTGPKILELCHCVQESQDHQLAKQVVGMRPTLELRNIQLLPKDIDALAFAVNSAGDHDVGLDFGACSMELECLDVLPRCQSIHYLSFHSRKYGDKFAEKLSPILPKFSHLRKLKFCGASLTATGVTSLASALQNCPAITEINLSDNNLTDEGIKHIADTILITKQPKLVMVMLGRNNSSLEAVDYLIGKMSLCLNIQHIHVDGTKELTVTFSDSKSHNTKSEPTISLLNQKWTKPEMQKLAKSLTRCPALSVLDMSGGHWDLKTLKTLTQFLPKFNVTKNIIANGSCTSVEGLVILTALLSHCPAVVELHIRLQSPVLMSIVFSGGREKPLNQISQKLCLSCCGLLPIHLEKVWRSLGKSSKLTLLDLSSNCLGNKGLRKLLEILPHLRSIQKVNASINGIGMEGVVMLAGALSSRNNLTQIHISDGDSQQVILTFSPDERNEKQQLKLLRINKSSLLPSNITTICRKFVQCRFQLELDLSHSSLTDKAMENLLNIMPKMTSLRRLILNNSITSTTGALMLLRCLSVCQQVTSVELRPQAESFIHFDSVKAKQTSCRLTHFCLNADNLESLIEILLQGPQLSDLDLSKNQLEDAGVKRFLDSLQELKITSYLNLSSNGLTQQGLLDVANTLWTCDNISGVEVSLGAEERCLIWFTQCEDCGKTLRFENNLLQLDWIEDFVIMLNSSQRRITVSIEECWIRSEEAVSLLCRCLGLSSNIHTIRVHHNTLHLTFKTSAELTSVSLMDCAVEGYQLSPLETIIQRCPLLTELHLSCNSLGTEGAEFFCSVLPSLPNLSSLSIATKEACVTAVEKLTEALLQATAIQSLNLSGHAISDTAAEIMTRMLPRLRSLNLSHCEWSAAGGLLLIKALEEGVPLEGLCLDSLQLNEESMVCLARALANNTSICSLKLNKKPTTMGLSGASGVPSDLLTAMEGLTRMEEIELEGWRMADEGIEKLTRLLPIWTELRKLSR